MRSRSLYLSFDIRENTWEKAKFIPQNSMLKKASLFERIGKFRNKL